MKVVLATLSLFLFSMTASFSQTKTEDIKELMELMDAEKTIDAMMDNMIPIFRQQATMLLKSEEGQEAMEDFMDFMLAKVKEVSKGMLDDMIPIYDKHFTHDEIKGLQAFYATPLGKKLLDKTPELSQEIMNLSMMKYMPEMQKAMREKLEQMR
jgi:hypothetical protein